MTQQVAVGARVKEAFVGVEASLPTERVTAQPGQFSLIFETIPHSRPSVKQPSSPL
jgi:hypothetical protein